MVAASEHRPLLAAVTPAFLDLAAFFTSDDKTALAARALLDTKDAFYTKLHTELKILSDILESQDNAAQIPDGTSIRRLLDVFESRFVSGSQVSN
jgi:hypothetical protein